VLALGHVVLALGHVVLALGHVMLALGLNEQRGICFCKA